MREQGAHQGRALISGPALSMPGADPAPERSRAQLVRAWSGVGAGQRAGRGSASALQPRSPMTHAHTDLSYDQELQELEKRVTAMGAEVCNMLDRALRALRAGDPRAAREVVVADNAVNRLEVEIDEMCLAI